jgi:outer membrane lipase/esterase
MIHRLRTCAAAALVFAASFGAGSAQAAFSGLFIFGDSLADSGNNALVFDYLVAPPGTPPGTLRTATPIPSSTFVPTFPYASDRYSNDAVWTEHFAHALGPTFSAQASLLGGTNFAFGGARSGGAMAAGDPPTLAAQAGGFLMASGGAVPSGALYVVQGGGNDARDAFELAAGGGDPSSLIDAYGDNIAWIVEQLEAAGARHILVANVPDIGKVPAILPAGLLAQGLASSIAMAMNNDLNDDLADLPAVPGAHLYRLDMFGLLNELVANPAAFGMTDVTSACAASAACILDPSTTFFWDGIHPTTAGHFLIAQQAALLVPEPQTYALLLAGLAVLLFAGRRNKNAC